MSGEFKQGRTTGSKFELPIDIGTAYQLSSIKRFREIPKDADVEKEALRDKYTCIYKKTEMLGYKKAKFTIKETSERRKKAGEKYCTKTAKNGSLLTRTHESLAKAKAYAKEKMFEDKSIKDIIIYIETKNGKAIPVMKANWEVEKDTNLSKRCGKNGKSYKWLPIHQYEYAVVLTDYENEYM